MLHTSRSPQEKRQSFVNGLRSGQLLRFPGAFAPIVAMQLERLGFEGMYISGGALAAELGLPDIGLTTLSEVTQRGRQIARVTDLPTIIDIDTGFGEPMNAYRSVRDLEEAGLAGCHLEDQENPKRCGHLDNKTLIDTATMCRKIRAAADARRDMNFQIIARTDARAVEGLSGALERARAYVDAGADIIFPEAMQNAAEFAALRSAINVPLLANMTEFGKSPLLTTGQLRDLGYNVVIYPVTSLRLAMKAITDNFRRIDADGTQEHVVANMQTRQELYDLLQYGAYTTFDQAIYNFVH